jgi:Ca2+ transporting ATPase
MIILMIVSVSTDDGEHGPGKTGKIFFRISNQLNYAVVLWMVSVPEGLPLAIGISIAFSVVKMYNDKLIVRKLEAPENLGTVDEILCGKTSTITTGYMKVDKFHTVQNQDFSELKKNSRKNTFFNCNLDPYVKELIQESIMFNCDARIEMKGKNFEPVGNSTECAFLRFLQDAEVPVHSLIKYKLTETKVTIPFQSSK